MRKEVKNGILKWRKNQDGRTARPKTLQRQIDCQNAYAKKFLKYALFIKNVFLFYDNLLHSRLSFTLPY